MPVSNNDLLKEIRSMAVKFEKVSERLDNFEQKLDNNVSEINNKLSDAVTSSTSGIEKVKIQMEIELAKVNNRIDILEDKMRNEGRVMDLVITGIPYSLDESLQSVISKLVSVINFDDEKSIVNINRLKYAHEPDVKNGVDSSKWPIIVKFASKLSRRQFHSKYFAFNKNNSLKMSHIGLVGDNRVYVNENLCKQDLELLRKAKKLKLKGKIAAVYSYDGRICVYRNKTDKKYDILYNVEDLKKYE